MKGSPRYKQCLGTYSVFKTGSGTNVFHVARKSAEGQARADPNSKSSALLLTNGQIFTFVWLRFQSKQLGEKCIYYLLWYIVLIRGGLYQEEFI